ncbi:MAG: hypothetical protein V7K19_15840 [Nostoc sp.]
MQPKVNSNPLKTGETPFCKNINFLQNGDASIKIKRSQLFVA